MLSRVLVPGTVQVLTVSLCTKNDGIRTPRLNLHHDQLSPLGAVTMSKISNRRRSRIFNRHKIIWLVIAALCLHVSLSYVVIPRHKSSKLESQPESIARDARVVTPISILTSLFLPHVSVALETKGTAFGVALNKYFPGALPTSVIGRRIVEVLRNRNYNPRNSVIASSLCVDEINDSHTSLILQLENALVDTKNIGVFHLGGLGGLPFVGVTGFGAFVQHCPDHGKLLVVFGPHVGISESGTLGKIKRIGMEAETASCGAAMAAYRAISSRTTKKSNLKSDLDFQQEYIIENLEKKLKELADEEQTGDDSSIALVTGKMYDLILEMLKDEIDTITSKSGFWEKVTEITLLGGIIINRSASEGEDCFQALSMKTLTATGESSIYDEAFGALSK